MTRLRKCTPKRRNRRVSLSNSLKALSEDVHEGLCRRIARLGIRHAQVLHGGLNVGVAEGLLDQREIHVPLDEMIGQGSASVHDNGISRQASQLRS